MATRKTDLPGVGVKHTIDLTTGDELVAVDHHGGHWELARVDEDGNSTTILQLPAREAGELGRILSRGEVATEDTRKQMLFDEFGIEWVTLNDDSPLAGQSLRESGVRMRTGASIIALLRQDSSMASPPPETVFQGGDTLVVMGHLDQVDLFLKTFTDLSED